MKRFLLLALFLVAGCQDNRVGEDFWYRNAEILCQRQHCPRCAETRGITCPNCEGTGEETCDRCHGEGKVRCGTCNGTGNLEAEVCPDCAGSGKESCARCGGDGRQTCDVCSGKRMVACIQRIPVDQAPATRAEDAWPPNNYQGAGVDN